MAMLLRSYGIGFIGCRFRQQIVFKSGALVYKIINGMISQYLYDICVPASSMIVPRCNRSTACGDLVLSTATRHHLQPITIKNSTTLHQRCRIVCLLTFLSNFQESDFYFKQPAGNESPFGKMNTSFSGQGPLLSRDLKYRSKPFTDWQMSAIAIAIQLGLKMTVDVQNKQYTHGRRINPQSCIYHTV